jgi:hypothetical protein
MRFSVSLSLDAGQTPVVGGAGMAALTPCAWMVQKESILFTPDSRFLIVLATSPILQGEARQIENDDVEEASRTADGLSQSLCTSRTLIGQFHRRTPFPHQHVYSVYQFKNGSHLRPCTHAYGQDSNGLQ